MLLPLNLFRIGFQSTRGSSLKERCIIVCINLSKVYAQLHLHNIPS